MNYGSDTLATISQDGQVPETRMKDARQVQDYCRRLIDNDEKRSWKRSRVNGLVDGNPPYRASKLREAGRAEACNVNWNISRSYMEAAVGAFYDLFSEAPGYITVRTDFGNDEQKETWSNIISEEIDRVFRNSKVWDYNMQISQWDMVLHGCGPFIFETAHQVLPKAILCGDLKVPELTKSDTFYWDAAMVETTYYPPQLYEFIQNEETAYKIGWDVEYTKLVIANAMDIRQQQGVRYDWEFYQQELKNNSLSYYDDSKVCRICHVMWKEFDGRITHVMVERDSSTTSMAQMKGDGVESDIKFLYRHIGRYAGFNNMVHPMYFDHGNGGYHHSVTGLGVKMYASMEYQNRLLCNLADKAFAPKIIFNPTTAENAQKFQLVHMGDYAVMPGGFQFQQTGVAGLMNDGIAMYNTVDQLQQSNLSSYRQQVPADKSGNPVTKYEKQLEAAQQSALNKTQFNRYYEQLDMLYEEIYRRLSNLNSTDERAKEFQNRCTRRGVPKEAISRVSNIQATRVVGQGSAFMRKQAIDSLFTIVGTLPEDGRTNLIADKIAAEAGQSAVNRYYPRKGTIMPDDQKAEAVQWVAAIKVGVTPVVTPNQNPMVYAQTFLAAAAQAMQSLSQGADPMSVLQFLEIIGPASAAHLQRLQKDPTRQTQFKLLSEQWKKLASVTDQLKQQIQKQQEQMKQQQQSSQGAMNDMQIKQLKAQTDIQIKKAKTAAQLQQSQDKHRLKLAQGVQDLAIKDASAAAEIHRNRLKAFQE